MWPLPPPSASLFPARTVGAAGTDATDATRRPVDAWLDSALTDRRVAPAAGAPSARWAGWRLRLLLGVALLGGLAIFAVARLVANAPLLDATWRADANGRLVLATTAVPALQPFQGRALVGISGTGQPPLAPDALALQPSSRWLIDDARRARHRAQHEALVAALARSPVTLRFDVDADEPQAIEAWPQPRGVARLPAVFWLFSLFGFGLGGVAVVVVLAQPSPRNVLYAVMAGSQAGNLVLIAVESTLQLGLPLPFPALDMPLRMAFDLTTAAAMLHAACLHPRRLAGANAFAGAGWMVALVALVVGTAGSRFTGAAGGVAGAWWWCQGGVIALGLGAVALLGWSYRLQPHPAALLLRRITLGVVGTLVLLTVALAAAEAETGLPLNLAAHGSMVWYVLVGSLLLLAPFLVNSHVVAREFSLLAAMGTIVMSLDLVFVSVFGLGRFASLSLALPIALAIYSGARQWIVNRLLGSSRLSAERTFERLYRIAREAEARPERTPALLSELLRELFEPIDVQQVDQPTPHSRVARDGSAMLVPLPDSGADAVVGASGEAAPVAVMVRFAHRGRRLFTSEDARLSDRVVEQLRRAVAYDKAVELGRKEERLRLAQDLHDDIGARLLTLMYKAQSPEMEDYVRHTLQDLKTLTRGLAAANHRLSYSAAEWKADLTQRLVAAQIELKWSLTFDDDIVLSVVQWSGLTRVLRELVSNAIAHARAERVEIDVALGNDRLDLSVTDDGIGRDPHTWSHGLGLGGVRKRVKQLGGDVQWCEAVPRGIVCRVVIHRLTSQR